MNNICDLKLGCIVLTFTEKGWAGKRVRLGEVVEKSFI